MTAERASRIKIAALILQAVVRDGLPYPARVEFRDDLELVTLYGLSIAEMRIWAPFFGAEIGTQHGHPTVPGVFLRADTAYQQRWNGWKVSLSGHDPDRTLGDDTDAQAIIDEAVAS